MKGNIMSFDLNKQNFSKAASEGYTFNLTLPDGTESDATLTVIGDMSKAVKAHSRKRYQELQLRSKTAARKGKDDELSIEEAEEYVIADSLVRLVNWSGFTEDGKEVPFSKDKAEEILREHSWIRDLILKEAAEVTNFSPKV